MLTINTARKVVKDEVRITAKARGKQATVTLDPAHSPDYNHALAASAVAAKVLTKEQQSRVRHPSFRGNYRIKDNGDGTMTHTVNV